MRVHGPLENSGPFHLTAEGRKYQDSAAYGRV